MSVVQNLDYATPDFGNLWRLAAESSTFGMTLADPNQPDCPLIYANQAFETLTGYSAEEVKGQNCRFLQGPDTDADAVAEIRQAIAERRSTTTLLLNYRKDGAPFWNRFQLSPVWDSSGALAAYLGVQVNLTRTVRLRRSETERQKMETLGRMASGVAHEINNALQPVLMLGDMLRQDIEQFEDRDLAKRMLKPANGIIESARFASDVVGDMMSFARGDDADEIDVDAFEMLSEAVRFAWDLLPSSTSVNLNQTAIDPIETGDACIRVNRTAFTQVFTNLFVNADHAMSSSGIIEVDAERVALHGDAAAALSLGSGDYVRISVRDFGGGIPEEAIDQIFEPFFTTKPSGEGTGLGLATVYGIVSAWGGTITAANHGDHGAIFTIYLPVRLTNGKGGRYE